DHFGARKGRRRQDEAILRYRARRHSRRSLLLSPRRHPAIRPPPNAIGSSSAQPFLAVLNLPSLLRLIFGLHASVPPPIRAELTTAPPRSTPLLPFAGPRRARFS